MSDRIGTRGPIPHVFTAQVRKRVERAARRGLTWRSVAGYAGITYNQLLDRMREADEWPRYLRQLKSQWSSDRISLLERLLSSGNLSPGEMLRVEKRLSELRDEDLMETFGADNTGVLTIKIVDMAEGDDDDDDDDDD